MQKFKIFYSWQSDLPSSRTRNFIRECIDEAIDLAQESEAIEAERDEATTGTTGSPNIVTTLFAKIDDCDLFIADLSLCFSEDQKREKKSPNPNVLLELGYAAKTLDWERVICLCNTDYGDNYPFDIAHNRITNFSLEGKSKKEVKSEIAKIIFTNIRELRKHPPRARAGVATHIIGTYDFETHKVIRVLTPIEIGKQESYVFHNEEILNNARSLVVEIQELMGKEEAISKEKDNLPLVFSESSEVSGDVQPQPHGVVHQKAEIYKVFEKPVVLKDVKEDKCRIKQWLGADVPDKFFDLGGLKHVAHAFNVHTPVLEGTDDEKTKYEKLQKLSYELLLLDIRTNYLKTFEGMCFVPLAIQNISAIKDEDIRIVVSVETGEIIEPDEKLIWEDYDGLQGILCRDDDDSADVGIICELFAMAEDGVIHTESIPYDPSRYIPKTPILTMNGLSRPSKTAEDYEKELEEFIASANGRGYYEFNIESLRPGESRWLCCGMLLRPISGKVRIRYQIHSAHSIGDLNGVLEMGIE